MLVVVAVAVAVAVVVVVVVVVVGGALISGRMLSCTFLRFHCFGGVGVGGVGGGGMLTFLAPAHIWMLRN